MRGTPERGVLIAIEGIDGAGKTTQVELLTAALRRAGEDVLTSKEPTDGTWGQKIRASAATGRMPPEEETEAFIKDREEHLSRKIQPALLQDRAVILDRYFYSTIAYQGSRGIDPVALERRLKALAPVPHIVFVLDLHPREALERIARRDGGPNHFERLDSLLPVRGAFRKMSAADDVIQEIDATLPANLVHAKIIHALIDGPLKSEWCAKHYGCDNPVFCTPRNTDTCRWARVAGLLRSRPSISPPELASVLT